MKRFPQLFLLTVVGCSTPPPRQGEPAPELRDARLSPPATATSSGTADASNAAPLVSASASTSPLAAPPSGLPTTFAWKEPTFGCSEGQSCDVPYFSSPGGRIPGAPLAIDISDLGAGATDRYPFEPAIELVGVVLSGTVDVSPIEDAGGKAIEGLGVWSGFRAPGGGVAIKARGGPARVFHLYVLRKGGGAVADKMSDPEAPKQPKIKTSFKRTDAISRFDLASAPELAWGGGAFRVHIGWEDSKAPAVVDAVVFAPTASVPEHVHPKEWECLLALTGEGQIVIEGQPKDVTPGTLTCIPPNTKHAWTPRGTDPLVGVQVYSPPGPEQRFKKLAEK